MIAISNIGKYQASHEPTGDVGIRIVTQNQIGLMIDKCAYNLVDTIICSEGITNTILVSKDNGATFQTQTLSYQVNRLYYSNGLNKFYLFEAQGEKTLHFAVSDDAINWEWVEYFSSQDEKMVSVVPASIKNDTTEGFSLNVFSFYSPTNGDDTQQQNNIVYHYEINILGNTFNEKALVKKYGYTDFDMERKCYNVRLEVFNNYTNDAQIISLSYTYDTSSSWGNASFKLTIGNWGCEKIDTNVRTTVKSCKYVYNSSASSSYATSSNIYYSVNGRVTTHLNFNAKDVQSFFNIGDVYIAYTKDKIIKGDTLQKVADCSLTSYGNLGDLTLICNAIPLTDKLVIFTSEMGTIYLCEVK